MVRNRLTDGKKDQENGEDGEVTRFSLIWESKKRGGPGSWKQMVVAIGTLSAIVAIVGIVARFVVMRLVELAQ